MELIEIKGLTKRYETKKALDNITINFSKGQVIGFFGPNGSGKTTLIKILAGLLLSYEGIVRINGMKPSVETKAIVSYLPDCTYLSSNWKVKEAVNVFDTFYNDFDSKKAFWLIERFKIKLDDRISTLSKGNLEKLQTILVLSRNALVYLFDEPIAGVDPASREVIFKLIMQNYNKDATVILTTHLIRDCEDILDRAVFINNGKIVFDELMEELKKKDNRSIDEIFREGFRCF